MAISSPSPSGFPNDLLPPSKRDSFDGELHFTREMTADADVDLGGLESDIESVTVEELEAKAKRAAEEVDVDDLIDLLPEDEDGAADAAPSVMSFFNGVPYSEGRKAYNQYRTAHRLAPIPEGRK